MPLTNEVCHVLDVLLPCHTPRTCFSGATSATLIVEHKAMLLSKRQELRQQVIMVSSRPTVEHQQARSIGLPILAPVKRD